MVTYCKPCHKEVQGRWQKGNPEKVAAIQKKRRKRRLDKQKFHRYGVTPERFAEMLDEQDYGCAICGCPETAKDNEGKVRSLSIDHCHETGVVRGLLCSACNNGLGHFVDDVARLETAIIYLLNSRHGNPSSRGEIAP